MEAAPPARERCDGAARRRQDAAGLETTTAAMMLLSEGAPRGGSSGDGSSEEQRPSKGRVVADVSESERPTSTDLLERDADQPSSSAKRKRKWRKSTNAIRREEKEELQLQVNDLRAQLQFWKARAYGQSKQAEEEQDRKCTTQMVENRRFRRALTAQQYELAPVHALLGECSFLEAQVGSPVHHFLHLPRDWDLRHAALVDAQINALRSSEQYLHSRRPRWDPCRHIREERSFEAPNGDSYFLSISTMQFDQIRSVHSAFEALRRFFSDLEIRISDRLGFLTVREDDDNAETEIPQNRFVSTGPVQHQVESNTVFFSQYMAKGEGAGGERGYGLIVTDYVDADDRYPYRSSNRVRRDINSILEVTSFVRQSHDNSPESPREEVVVVLTRWAYAKLHYPAFHLQPATWRALRDSTELWIKLLHPSLLETLV